MLVYTVCQEYPDSHRTMRDRILLSHTVPTYMVPKLLTLLTINSGMIKNLLLQLDYMDRFYLSTKSKSWSPLMFSVGCNMVVIP